MARDSSVMGTAQNILKPQTWTKRSPARNTRLLGADLQQEIAQDGQRQLSSPSSPGRLAPTSSERTEDGLAFKTKIRDVHKVLDTLKMEQVSDRERIDAVEAATVILDDVVEKYELMEDYINERLDACETKIMAEMDDRLGPLEVFHKKFLAHDAKRKHKVQSKAIAEGCEDASVRNGKRRKRIEREDSNDQGSQHEYKATSMTASFTTTTSSFSSSSQQGSVRTEHFEEMSTFLSEIQARLVDVESVSAPTRQRPWAVEVFFIPPYPLKGIWGDAGASIPNTQRTSSEGASASTAQASQALGPQPSGVVPYSFSSVSRVYQRLQSRGFVKSFEFTGSTAKEVSVAIESGFKDIFELVARFTVPRVSPSQPMSQTPSQRTSKGGTPRVALWQPLRKITKQVPLEFLSPDEISTPALWTVDFLKANCLMKGKQRKCLYITPICSTQTTSTLTWKHIKGLGPYRTPTASQEEDPGEATEVEGDADEPFWEFDPKLDATFLDDIPNVPHGSLQPSSQPFGSGKPFDPQQGVRFPAEISLKGSVSNQQRPSFQRLDGSPSFDSEQGVNPLAISLDRSFSSHLPGLSFQKQQETPPETNTHPRKSRSGTSKDHKISREPGINVGPRRRSTSTKSMPARGSTPSPPSPPHTFPFPSQRRRTLEGNIPAFAIRGSDQDAEDDTEEDQDDEEDDDDDGDKPAYNDGEEHPVKLEGSLSLLTNTTPGGELPDQSFDDFETCRTGSLREAHGYVESVVSSMSQGFSFVEQHADMEWGTLSGSSLHLDNSNASRLPEDEDTQENTAFRVASPYHSDIPTSQVTEVDIPTSQATEAVASLPCSQTPQTEDPAEKRPSS